jgi:hypothetical protein
MDVLVHWRWTAFSRPSRDVDRFHDVEAITCDGRMVAVVASHDTFRFPLEWVAEFQALDEDL